MRRARLQPMGQFYRSTRLLLLLAVAMIICTATASQSMPNVEDTLVSLARRQTQVEDTNCQDRIYCKPKAGEQVTGDSIFVDWTNDRFGTEGAVLVRLVAADDPNTSLFQQKFDAQLNSASETYVRILPSFFKPPPQPGQTATRSVQFLIGTPGNPTSSPPGPVFSISMVGSNTSPSSVPTPTALPGPQGETDKSVPSPAISTPLAIGIGVAGAAFVAMVIALLIFVIRRHREANRKASNLDSQKTMGTATGLSVGAGTSLTPENKPYPGGTSIDSSTPLAMQPPQGNGSNNTTGANSPLSVGDAALNAATYRKMMRKEEDDNGSEGLDAEQRRRQTSERVLREELAQEGYGLQHVNAGAAVRIGDAQSELNTDEEPALLSPLSSESPESATR